MTALCPTRAELDSFQAGDLDEAALTAVASHVESCPSCQRSLETIIGDSADTVLAALLEEVAPSPFAAEPACRVAIERVAALAGSATSDSESSPTTIVLRGAPIVAVDEPLPLETIREYMLLAKIGEGGMGAVYKALHTRLDKIVALKVLPEGRMRDGGSVARFQREMKAVGRLDHPNIVRAMDAGEEEGMHFLVMEYVEGADLSQLAKNIGPLPVADACELVRQAAIGLQEAHEHGMVHRDIKPSNLILAKPARKKSPPTLKILDLGLALLSEALLPDHQGLTYTGQMMGTIDYMAPEQGGDSHQVDIRADIYSLGATLYKLLTGSAPFAGEKFDTPVKKILALATLEPQAVQTRRADVPPPVAAIVHKMLAKEPAQRYATPDELIEALTPFCQGANLTTLLERGTQASQPAKAASDAPTHPQLSSGSADTAPTIDRSVKGGTKRGPTSRAMLSGLGRKPRFVVVVAACGGVALLLLMGVVFYLETLKGTIRIEIDDKDITAALDEDSATFKGMDKKNHSIRVEAGQHGLKITRGDLTFYTDRFDLKKGDTIRLSVKYLPGKVQVMNETDGTSLGEKKIAQPKDALAMGGAGKPPADAVPAPSGGYALRFTDDGDQVDTSEVKLQKSGPWTVEGWITPREPLLSQGGQAALVFMVNPCWLSVKNGPGGIKWAVGGPTSRPGSTRYSSDKVVAGEPTHVAFTCGPAGVSFFVSGVLQGEPLPIVFFDDQSRLRIRLPANPTARDVTFQGDIDEVRVSSVERYQGNFVPKTRFEPDADTLALYHFDEGQGDELKDSSGLNRHGKIVGAKWVRADAWQGWSKDTPPPAITPFDANQARKRQEQWATYLGVPVEYENSIGMKFVLIPPGEFMMGSTAEEIEDAVKAERGEKDGQELVHSEAPQHRVILTQPIYIGIHEVTQGQYAHVMGKNPSHFAPLGTGRNAVVGIDTTIHPVELVNWKDAVEFCAKLSQQEKLQPLDFLAGKRVTPLRGAGYRLPTEAEWEFACRAGTTTKYWLSDAKLPLAGWFAANSGGRTHAVGELKVNPFGLYDMQGNVLEFVHDWWEPNYYKRFQEKPAIDPSGPSSVGSQCVMRGGSWFFSASHCRSSHRLARDPSLSHRDVGFRVTLAVDAVKKAIQARKAISGTERDCALHFSDAGEQLESR